MTGSTGDAPPSLDAWPFPEEHRRRIEQIRELILHGGKIGVGDHKDVVPDHLTVLTLAHMVHQFDRLEWQHDTGRDDNGEPSLIDLLRNCRVRGHYVSDGQWLTTAAAMDIETGNGTTTHYDTLLRQLTGDDVAASKMELMPQVDPYIPFVATDVAKLRREVCAWLLSPTGREFYTDGIRNGRQSVTVPQMHHDPAGYLVRHEHQTLAGAPLYFIDHDMCQLTAASYPTMPRFVPTPDDLPSPIGFAIFAAPVSQHLTSLYHGQEHITIPTSNGPLNLSEMVADTPTQIIGASWRVVRSDYTRNSRWKAGSVWVTFYSYPTVRVMFGKGGKYRELWRPDAESYPLVCPDNELLFGLYDAATMPGGPEAYEDALPADVHGVADWARILMAAFMLSRQKGLGHVETVRIAARKVSNTKARQTGQKYTQPEEIKVVKLRQQVRAARERQAPEDDSDKAQRQYRVRWLVQGFWRNQWYPASGTHRPYWIADYVKGPQDAPFKRKGDTVRVVSPPGKK